MPELLQRLTYDTSGLHSKWWEELAERRFAFADTHRMLNQRISIFISQRLASLDRLALKRRLDEIGRSGSNASREET